MKTRKELLQTKDFWIFKIQNKLFRLMNDFMQENDMKRKDLADKLGYTKGYISQLLNGDFDGKISKLVELAMVTGKVPVIEFRDLDDCIAEDARGDLATQDDFGKVKMNFNLLNKSVACYDINLISNVLQNNIQTGGDVRYSEIKPQNSYFQVLGKA
ncbi:MAG: transcriptional regulator with XRE-family HTH domain [Arenicella sp.]|jgi:transcriptional regulator with XRE-family HTH domain